MSYRRRLRRDLAELAADRTKTSLEAPRRVRVEERLELATGEVVEVVHALEGPGGDPVEVVLARVHADAAGVLTVESLTPGIAIPGHPACTVAP